MAGPSLKTRMIRGSAWTIGAYGAAQVLRLLSSLVLTRLLFPEAFGLMTTVNLFMQGLAMFSDMGIGPSVIRSSKSGQPEFLNTAWTIQVTRGAGLWLCAVALAWPMAWFYEAGELRYLLPVAGLTALIAGFNSTSLFTCNRKLEIGKLTLVDIGTQVISLIVTALLAWQWRSVWTLVIGALFGTTLKMALSHLVLPGLRNRIYFDRAFAREMLRFGRWIFLGTALTFIVSHGDKAVLGKVMDKAQFGVYSVAFVMASAMVEIIRSLSGRVLFPVYAQLAEQRGDKLKSRNRRVRLVLLGLALPVLWGLAIFGYEIIRFFYDDRYLDAGWMVSVLAIGSIGSVITLTSNAVTLAVGDSFRYTVVQASRSIMLVGGMAIGGRLGGVPGVLWGFAASSYLNYPVLVWATRRYGVWQPALDGAAVAVSAAVIGAGWWLWR